MDFMDNTIILDLSVGGNSVVGTENAVEAENNVTTSVGVANSDNVPASANGTGFFSMQGFGGIIIYVVGLIALFYFFAIRPQKKREKELKEMQNAINVGDWVMTSSGFYGKVVDMSDQVFVVEFGTNKGVRIPINKNEIVGNREPNFSKSSEDTTEEK